MTSKQREMDRRTYATALAETLTTTLTRRPPVSERVKNMSTVGGAVELAIYRKSLECKNNTFQGYTTDVCVPLSKLSQVLVETKKDIEASNLVG